MFKQNKRALLASAFVLCATVLNAQDFGPSEYGIDVDLLGDLLRPGQNVPTVPNALGIEIDDETLQLLSPRELSEILLYPGVTIGEGFVFDLNDPLRDNRPVSELDPAIQAIIFAHNRDPNGLETIADRQEVIDQFGSNASFNDIVSGLQIAQSQPLAMLTPNNVSAILAQQPGLTDTARAVVWNEFLNENQRGFADIGLAKAMAFAAEPLSEDFSILLAQSNPETRDVLMAEWLGANADTTDPRALGALYDQFYEGFELPQIDGLTPPSTEETLGRLAPLGVDPMADHLRARIELDQGNLEGALAAFKQAISGANSPATALTDYARFSAQNPDLPGVLSDPQIVTTYLDAFVGGDFGALEELGKNPAVPDAVIITAIAQASQRAATPQERAIAAQQERNLCAAFDIEEGGPCEAPAMIYFTNREVASNGGYSNEPESGDDVHFGRLSVPLLSELYRRRDDLSRWGARACVTETWLAEWRNGCDQDIVRNATDAGPLVFEASEDSSFVDTIQPLATGEEPSRAVIYIHGFNNSLEDAARDFARIILTARLRGHFQPILISWPSQATLFFNTNGRLSMPSKQYREDRDRVRDACLSVYGALSDIVTTYGSDKIDIIVHSMGSYMLQQALSGCPSDTNPVPRIQNRIAENIIFTAADLATSVFDADRALIMAAATRVTVYIAPSDPVLEYSSSLERMENGLGDGPRLGSGYDTLTNTADGHLMIVNTLLTEFVETASGPSLYNTNHSYHINTPAVRRDISMILHGHYLDQAERCLAPSDEVLDAAADRPRSYFIVPNCL